nr:hypothetical protein [uncultured Desulfobacter sp.]
MKVTKKNFIGIIITGFCMLMVIIPVTLVQAGQDPCEHYLIKANEAYNRGDMEANKRYHKMMNECTKQNPNHDRSGYVVPK